MYPIEVAVPAPLPRTFTYLGDREIPAGVRVVVPFAGRQLIGVVLGPGQPGDGSFELKNIRSVVDEAPVYNQLLLDLGRWMSSYYQHPLGEVLRTMLPASATPNTRTNYQLSAAGRRLFDDLSTSEGHLLAVLFKDRDQLSAQLLRSRLKKISDAPTLQTLVTNGWLKKSSEKTKKARKTSSANAKSTTPVAPTQTPRLTERQQAVLSTMLKDGVDSAGSRVFLLHGVTGSGKTEVYLHLIAEVLARDPSAQALVLVPEISLTPQMTRVFEQRFPGLVAVVHSAMTAAERWARLESIRAGAARILIGPRSAVFAPFCSLRLLIVDEEHDGSYKQSSGLSYNGRDVAVVRGKMEGATVVLGSATPSLESINNARLGRYTLLAMPERVNQRPLPSIELVEFAVARRVGQVVHSQTHQRHQLSSGSPGFPGKSPGIEHERSLPAEDAETMDDKDLPIAPVVVEALRDNLARGHQAMVLVNRRGYAYYLFSLEQKKPVECPHCSISMTLHARSTILRCHYCDHRVPVKQIIAGREAETFVAVGYGSQRAEELLARKVPGARVARLDSDVVVDREALPKTLGKFRDGEVDILVGTQMLAKGHDFPNVTLIVILEVDQALMLPDFRAGERTFQLIVQAAGRAGRADLPGKVMIQTQLASHPLIQAAIKQDYTAFAQHELEFRRCHFYPPFSRMVAIELNSPEDSALEQMGRRIDAWIAELSRMRPEVLAKIRVLGPAVPPIERVRGRSRRLLVISSEQIEPLRQFVSLFLLAFERLPGDMRLLLDVDPQSLI